ncbi:undecaprenyldiphospho-muramoylpentapeptide beta-N-acetylglucosaminyltransferase [Oceanibacterium hippocampi]|uniref:UDP-N-acetylglucosamine--N-acetylmuramyl-(pentapeptide) pyrophosphoryl-undecaprenol N-acetylglucosamine transferase n=1 Tax=Oceanibacterium hippocampi TaxID=745714 RepID=A0A1Y5SCI8_9PROT|nr:undecaprenyldiphospho-muramoylpentapeptide beta-N-acetylglucosaminyltransferase [Oceanibacterium hippocampi]SLN37308.1 UDP-N-acetylglucosamine--N-acetylmuramyl-(pentapeptide) pyrophosphoryl-undecaprenol N-acetylglucosamine transferase [Oceanibacterium hippocampi]
MSEIGRTILLAAGGTGGHVLPAQSLAVELQSRGWQVALATDARGERYEALFPGVTVHRLPAGTFSSPGLGAKLRAGLAIVNGYRLARRLIRRLDPVAVVGFGGYPSLPTMLAATRGSRPTVLHEQNAVLGRVNRLLAPRATRIATGFETIEGVRPDDLAKVVLVGNPVRQAIAAVRALPYTAPGDGGALRLLVLGGSQGATVFSEIVPEALGRLPQAMRRRIRITQQCRAEDLEAVRQRYRDLGITADLASFVSDVPALLGSCHLAITRAGASTVSELAVAGRPSILVPYPHATDDHQSANARALVAAGGAWVMPQDKFTIDSCRQTLEALLSDPESLQEMADGARSAGRPEAARDLADLVEKLLPEQSRLGRQSTVTRTMVAA